jgi:FKBP-type peptidyl-prolyl cis-trans isomerase FkpA
MKRVIYLFIATAFLFSACKSSFKKGKGGVVYKVDKTGSGETIQQGQFLEFHSKNTYRDSVLSDTRLTMAQVQPFDSTQIPPDDYKILKELRKGDKITYKISTDSAFKGGQMAPWAKKGEYIITEISIVNIYKTRDEAQAAYRAAAAEGQKKADAKLLVDKKAQLDKDEKIISEYLTKNNITATVKSPLGVHVQIITPGTDKITDSSNVKINYTGQTLAGVVFDSNTDPKFGHLEPYIVSMGAPQVIKGWIESLNMLSKGAKARIYVPSTLGYGEQGNGANIPPNENLVFDMEILDLLSPQQAQMEQMAAQQKQQQQMMEQQKKMEAMSKKTPSVPAADSVKRK